MENFYYNSQSHKLQHQVQNLSDEQKVDYIKNKWMSEKFHSKDLITTNESEPCLLVNNKESIFIRKFLNKKSKRLQKIDESSDNSDEIPEEFLKLLKLDIFKSSTSVESIESASLW